MGSEPLKVNFQVFPQSLTCLYEAKRWKFSFGIDSETAHQEPQVKG